MRRPTAPPRAGRQNSGSRTVTSTKSSGSSSPWSPARPWRFRRTTNGSRSGSNETEACRPRPPQFPRAASLQLPGPGTPFIIPASLRGERMLPDDAPKGILRDYFETIVTCVIFVVFARTYVFQQSKIPTGSMIPTLLVGDYIMVNKFAFAPLSSVPALARAEHALLPVRDLKRGDIIVFKYPEEPEKDYIKRVIGLPGEVLQIRDRQVYIDGKPLDE